MRKKDQASYVDFDIEQIELKGFSRSIAEIEWLLLLLVILYFVLPGTEVANEAGMLIALHFYAAFILGFHYLNFSSKPYRWKLALETWVMILFITWAVWNTGSVDSPLMNLYLLVVIASAITLGKVITLLEVGLIGAFYFYIASISGIQYDFIGFTGLLIYFAPLLLVAYITTMLAADVKYGRQMFKVLSETDEMTKLLNKRSFSPMYKKAAEVAMKYSKPLSVMMIDADNLKDVNDTHGHNAGDRLIKAIAHTLEDCLRASDVICRFGGDEFAAMLPDLDGDKAIETGERLRQAIENISFDANGKAIGATVSIGIASYPEDVADAHDLMDAADKALYESKKAGRNSVVTYARVRQQGIKDTHQKSAVTFRTADQRKKENVSG